MILVAGGTGRLGREVVGRLVERGLRVRVLARDPALASTIVPGAVEIVAGDVRDAEALAHATVGVDTVVSAVTGFGRPGAAGPRAIDRDGNLGLLACARAAGSGHFVLVSVAGASPDDPRELRRMKAAAEEAVRASGIPWTILRPRPYMETFVDVIGRPLAETGRTRVFGRGDNPVNFVSVHDVAAFVERAVTDPGLRGRTIEVAGPENLTLDAFVETFRAVTGVRGSVGHAPVPLMRILSAILAPVDPILAARLQAGVSMATTDMAADGPASRRDYQDLPFTTLADAIERERAPAQTLSSRARLREHPSQGG